MFLWVKKGDRLQTSASLSVLLVATLNMGSTNETVTQDQNVTLSSGIVRPFDGTYKILNVCHGNQTEVKSYIFLASNVGSWKSAS